MIERITRSLAFMLRHQPEQFDLELDAYGWADVGDVVRALNERLGEPVRDEDVVTAVGSGDRVRYQIEGDRIRALYGHSVPVEPGDASKPPEKFYVAIPQRDLERAQRFGLRGGRRRFLHLALTEEDARESGRRNAVDYTVLTVRALDAWEEGVNFYDRTSLWLAEEVPTHLLDVGETYHDGTERERERGGRDSRGRGRGDHRGGRDRGRGRGGRGRSGERSRSDAPRDSERGSRDSRDNGERGGGRRRGHDDQRRYDAPREERRERQPAAEPAVASPAPKRAPAKTSRSEASATFGSGLTDPSKTSRAPKAPEPPAPPEPKSEPAPKSAAPERAAPPSSKEPSGPGFGAGL